MQAAPRSDSDLKLLLVVNRDARVLLPIRISPVDGHRAALAVSRDDHARSKHNFAALFRDHMNGAVVYLFHRAHVFAWISGGWILFSVKFSRPLAVRLCAVRRGALDRDLNVVAGSFVGDRFVLRSACCKFRFCLVQLPGSHHRVAASEGHRRRDHHERQET